MKGTKSGRGISFHGGSWCNMQQACILFIDARMRISARRKIPICSDRSCYRVLWATKQMGEMNNKMTSQLRWMRW